MTSGSSGRRSSDHTPKAGEYLQLSPSRLTWRHAKGEPEGVDEVVLHRHEDGSYTHVFRIRKGVEFTQPVKHDFF